jgi:putative SOS response-associated peptidase YedK
MHIQSMKNVFDDLPRYNAAPKQWMPVVAVQDNKIIAKIMRWWLVPGWSKDGSMKITTFNARAENLDKSRLFLPYFKSSRCLIPVDAFYEWKRISSQMEVRGKIKNIAEKQAMCIRMKDGKTFMLAGLFSVWKNEKGEEIPGFTVITTEPNKLISDIHNRMPVILPEKHFEQWLDREYKDIDNLKKLLVAYPASKMQAYAVSDYMNNPRNEGSDCMKPLKE